MKYSFYFDAKRCSGCSTCMVACMDQNDIDVLRDNLSWRKVFQVEQPELPAKVSYVSLSCMHCEDAPCMVACPTAAIYKEPETGAVLVRSELCIGCRSCSLACPFGAPRYGVDGKMQKCRLCVERVANGMEPACVSACPTQALKFGEANSFGDMAQGKYAKRIAALTE